MTRSSNQQLAQHQEFKELELEEISELSSEIVRAHEKGDRNNLMGLPLKRKNSDEVIQPIQQLTRKKKKASLAKQDAE